MVFYFLPFDQKRGKALAENVIFVSKKIAGFPALVVLFEQGQEIRRAKKHLTALNECLWNQPGYLYLSNP